MPKFPKTFGRRKSIANQFEDIADLPPSEHSFKVFERPDRDVNSFDGGVKYTRAATASPARLHVDDDNLFAQNGHTRSTSHTNTNSTADNSSRLSGASTAPSSTDTPHNDWKSPHDKPFNDIPPPPAPRASSGFSLKNAGRAMSWGRHKSPSPHTETQPITVSKQSNEDEEDASRSRAVTASSYASTAVPPKLEHTNLGLSLGGDFSDMFAGFGKRKSVVLEHETAKATALNTETGPANPATRTYTNNRASNIPPLNIDNDKDVEPSPYSWSSHHSTEGLMSHTVQPPPISKQDPPPVPQHGALQKDSASPASFTRPQRQGKQADQGLRRNSVFGQRRQSTSDQRDSMDEDARLLRESVTVSRRLNDQGYSSGGQDEKLTPARSNQKGGHVTTTTWRAGSVQTTPQPEREILNYNDENMFDSQIAASANLLTRFEEKSSTPPVAQRPQSRVMTPAQFERYKQDQERLRSVGGGSVGEDNEDEDDAYDDEEDDAEKAKELARQRRKQEAHMAVYRQQMMKVTGETPGSSARPSPFASQSSPNIKILGTSDANEEEDEEVPLAILQAHGFPNKTKPPMRSAGSNPNLRSTASSTAGGVVDPRLPVFARHLPQDPYYGAGIVKPMHRESMAFGGGSASVSGGSKGLPPGGLVGVIATEERSRAMRRGSPNPSGDYGSLPSNTFNGLGTPPTILPSVPSGTGSIYGGVASNPMGQMGSMGSMMTPGDQAQIQMTQQMQQFMQMQMQFMQMMTTQSQQSGHMSHQSLQIPRPGSGQGMRSASSHQRSLTMLEPNSAPWNQQRASSWTPSVHVGNAGYAPSIAPSERSNIGLPGRYRPVSHAPAVPPHQVSPSLMSGGRQDFKENQNAATTIRPVKKNGNVSDEDDEEGWEEMARKKREKKSLRRTKKDKESSGLKEMLGLPN